MDLCRHVCPVCGGCDICCLRDHDTDDDQRDNVIDGGYID